MTARPVAAVALLGALVLASCDRSANEAATPGFPRVAGTEVLGPIVGPGATLHPDNLEPARIEYYGTDLGFTYRHGDHLEFLFGDTMANEAGDPIEPQSGGRFEDSYGQVDLAQWDDPAKFSADRLPLLRLGQNPGTTSAAAIDPGHALEVFKTPVGGFSNGRDEFAVFFTYKPQGCRVDADCAGGARCDVGLGYLGAPWSDDAGLTFGCLDGSPPDCIAAALPDDDTAGPSGLCNDRGSTLFADTPMGRIGSLTVKLLIGTRDRDVRKRYTVDHAWQTSRFMNPSLRTVTTFVPGGDGTAPRIDYRAADLPSPEARVFVWGRPHFVGVNATGRSVGMYFAYLDLPADGAYDWRPRYFAGLDDDGNPHFSDDESRAAAIDLDATVDGVQSADVVDIVDQVSIAWVPALAKWLMFYGGGMTTLPIEPAWPDCGVLELFAGPECSAVRIGNGAFRMRSADHPWGPWSPPEDLIAAGDPAIPEGQYGPGGMLRHPACTARDCAPFTNADHTPPDDYGFFYGANIIEQWTRPAGDGVDVIWNASTWNPYRVILLRTRISPSR